MERAAPIRKMSAEQVFVLLERGGDVTPIDTLPSEWYEKRRLPGAKNACVYEVTFPDQIEAIAPDRDHNIVVYGSSFHSYDAAVAAEKLSRLGYRRIYLLEGGVEAWRAAGYPLEGTEPEKIDEPDMTIPLEDRDYSVDVSKSSIEWTGRNATTSIWVRSGCPRGNSAYETA
ncbi:MAG: rhodanese-like domain-containing protein [Deltaproteobacteria bacterium]|nr:rhodanese-like domain-containing protein [Deltaproteobacteria bacterium]